MAPMSATRDNAVPHTPCLSSRYNGNTPINKLTMKINVICQGFQQRHSFTVPMLDQYKNFLKGRNYIELKLGKPCSIRLTAYTLSNQYLLMILMAYFFCKNLFSSFLLFLSFNYQWVTIKLTVQTGTLLRMNMEGSDIMVDDRV